MKLIIAKDYNKSFTDSTCNLSTDMLRLNSTHLFIASNMWESIRIEIDGSIPRGTLRKLSTVCEDIKVSVPAHIDENILHLLTELYPSKAGVLRRTFMQGGDVKGVIRDVLWIRTDT